MAQIANGDHGGLLTIGLLGSLWSSSSAMVAVVGAMNRAYDIDESRAWWRVRLTAIVLTIVLSIFIVLSFALIVVEPQVADYLASHVGVDPPSCGAGRSSSGLSLSRWSSWGSASFTISRRMPSRCGCG